MQKIPRSWIWLVLPFFLVSCPAKGFGAPQVDARQGDPKEERPNDFTSPMVLELPLPNLSELEDREAHRFGDGIKEYYCDDVAIHELRLKRDRRRPKRGGARIFFDLRGKLYVRPSHDREVTLTLALVQGENSLAETVIEDIEAEEKKYKSFKSRLDPRESDLDAAFATEPEPLLRITMWVRKD